MSDYDANRSDATNNDTLDDTTGTTDKSIIGRVKSRVSNILPNSLYKWLLPSNETNDSINGNVSEGLSGFSSARRRRRIELEEDDDDDDGEEEDAEEEEEEDEDATAKQQQIRIDYINLSHHQNTNTDEESNNSEDEATTTTRATVLTKITGRRTVNATVHEPPTKRSRYTLDLSTTRNNILTPRQPLLSSTPTALNNSKGNMSKVATLKGERHEKESPLCNFNANAITSREKVPNYETSPKGTGTQSAALSSRRSLNITPRSYVDRESHGGLTNLRRQNLNSVSGEMPSTSYGVSHGRNALTPKSNTHVVEVVREERELKSDEELNAEQEQSNDSTKYNGRSNSFIEKQQRLLNGSGRNAEPALVSRNPENLRDSSVSSSEGVGNGTAESVASISGNVNTQRKTGLFNMSSTNSKNGSRTSSFGNGLNFYSHLEGRKSLFSEAQSVKSVNAINNSTLSLTSLNRRQFNASIYGSTSALSDSRLLNTFSPFYNGRTTYGGAAAYNKYSTGGPQSVRITPTLIRPISSLSTLSSSSNSLAFAGPSSGGVENSAISSTAKRILDIINDFPTPLSEAKKMASNLKLNQQQQQQLLPQSKSRLNDSYLEQARSMRLSQVRTPYARPTVTLSSKPAHVNGQAGASQLPPVRELQVPSMSQLLQMKKLQSTTERSRQIAKQNNVSTTQKVHNTEYTLPIAVEKSKVTPGKEHEQKHTSKMKQKVTTTAHTSKKHQDDDAPPPAVNLPNVAFPLMKSLPRFNITLPNMPTSLKSTSTPISTSVVSTAGPATAAVPSGKLNLSAADTNAAFSSGTTKLESKSSSVIFNSVGSDASKTDSASTGNAKSIFAIDNSNKDMQSATKSSPTTFKFSNPVIVKDSNELNRTVLQFNGEFKFSPPTLVAADANKEAATLKSGSCLDALKKPFVLPASIGSVSTVPTTPPKKEVEATMPSGFGAQFKKSAGEWECEACMLRNKSDATKCVACETPHKSPSTPSMSSTSTDPAKAPLISNSFGSQFKKSVNEWECDACMVRNKIEDGKCVACETPRKGAKDSNATSSSMPMPMSTSTATVSNVTPIKSLFGDAFKPKEGVWTCSTCLIQNQSSAIECVACQAKKPGVTGSTTAPANQFKFGLKPTSNTDAGFKAIAAEQKASKWECEACMTRNDANKQKCVCCDQAKPGSQMTSETVPKFSFGSTASSKFSFGFNAANVQPTSSKTEATSTTITSTTTATTSTSVSLDAPAKSGFVFGCVSSSEPKQTQSAIGITFGFKPVSKSDADATVSTSSTTTTTTTVSKGFAFGSSSTTGKSVTDVANSTPSVKFSLPTTTAIKSTETVDSASKLTTAPSVTFGFGSSAASTSITASQPSGGFSFGTPPKPVADANKTAVSKESNTLGGFTFKAPTATSVPESQPKSFSFGAVATTTSANTTPAAAIKPIFSFGASTTNTPSASASAIGTTGDAAPISSTGVPTIATAPTTTTSTNTFNFGGNTNTVAKTNFGTTPASTAPTSGNVFGTFGNAAAPAASIFGSESKPISTQATAAPGTNVFGSFGGQSAGTKPTASATPLFGGNVASNSSSTTASTAAASGPFVFGAAASMKSPGNTTTGVSAVPTTSTTSAWSQNTFTFGSAAATAPAVGTSDTANKSVFGAFASPQTNNNNAVSSGGSSIFGSISAGAKAPHTQGFGSNANNSTSIFGSNTTLTPNPAPPGASANIFGASSVGAGTSAFGAAPTAFNSSNSATSNAAPTFGSAATQAAPAFGSAATQAAPAFGSAPTQAAPTTFGAFGSGGATAPTVPNTDGASAAKKQELAYNFGSTPAQNATGGFNFSTAAATAKPAFNFGSTAQPAFNFTGSTETQTTKPFQFGATTSAPVFNFGGGAVEATSNAPFQFSSGAASASSNNIFAPNPTNAQSAQVARRKIRAPIRRMTPR